MAAPTETYIDPNIAGASGAGSIGDPYGDVQHALDTVTRDATGGDRFNIKAGTDELLAAALDFSTYGTPTMTAPWICQGYTSAAGDGGIGGISGGGSVAIVAASAIDFLSFIDMHLHNCGAADVIDIDNFNSFINCEIDNTSGLGLKLDDDALVFNCHVHNCDGIQVNNDSILAFNTVETGANPIVIGISLGINSNVAIFNVIDLGGGSARGISANADKPVIFGNSIFGVASTAEGIYLSASAQNAVVANNIIEGISGIGGNGIEITAGATLLLYGNNAFYNNTTNLVDNSEFILIDNTANDQALGSSPFTNAANDDFTVTTAVKALGYPTANYPNLAVRTYLDIGALQRVEPAGGAGSGKSTGGVPHVW